MICLDCKNKNICRHYPNFMSAIEVVTLTVSDCERFIGTEEVSKAPTPTRTPLIDPMTKTIKPKEASEVFVPLVDRLTTGYPDFNVNKKAESLEIFGGKKNDIVVREPQYQTGECSYCHEEKEVYVCDCGNVCCEECGMPPYCKDCWEGN